LQTTLAAEAHLAEGQFLVEEQTLNKGKSLVRRTGTRRPTISKADNNNNNAVVVLVVKIVAVVVEVVVVTAASPAVVVLVA
jgi:hypothetical protein